MKRNELPFYHASMSIGERRGMTCWFCGRPIPKHFYQISTEGDQRLKDRALDTRNDHRPVLCSWFCTKSWILEAINLYEMEDE